MEDVKSAFANKLSAKNVTAVYKRLIGSNQLGVNDTELQTRYSMPLWAYEALDENIPLTQKCCSVLKKNLRPKGLFSLTGEMIEESELRKASFKKYCTIIII